MLTTNKQRKEEDLIDFRLINEMPTELKKKDIHEVYASSIVRFTHFRKHHTAYQKQIAICPIRLDALKQFFM